MNTLYKTRCSSCHRHPPQYRCYYKAAGMYIFWPFPSGGGGIFVQIEKQGRIWRRTSWKKGREKGGPPTTLFRALGTIFYWSLITRTANSLTSKFFVQLNPKKGHFTLTRTAVLVSVKCPFFWAVNSPKCIYLPIWNSLIPKCAIDRKIPRKSRQPTVECRLSKN